MKVVSSLRRLTRVMCLECLIYQELGWYRDDDSSLAFARDFFVHKKCWRLVFGTLNTIKGEEKWKRKF